MREKYYWAGWSWSWWLEWCEKKILLGWSWSWSWSWLPNGVIECANILLDINGTVKAGDFGLAKLVVFFLSLSFDSFKYINFLIFGSRASDI